MDGGKGSHHLFQLQASAVGTLPPLCQAVLTIFMSLQTHASDSLFKRKFLQNPGG